MLPDKSATNGSSGVRALIRSGIAGALVFDEAEIAGRVIEWLQHSLTDFTARVNNVYRVDRKTDTLFNDVETPDIYMCCLKLNNFRILLLIIHSLDALI